jgi:ATP-dependent Clp protease adaptor protein ClpS
LYKLINQLLSPRFAGLYEYRKGHPIELPSVDSNLKQSILNGKNLGHFQVVIYNDDTTPMEFVMEVLEYYLGYNVKDATLKMAQIHKTGCSDVYTSTEELASIACQLIQEATQTKKHSLKCAVQSL